MDGGADVKRSKMGSFRLRTLDHNQLRAITGTLPTKFLSLSRKKKERMKQKNNKNGHLGAKCGEHDGDIGIEVRILQMPRFVDMTPESCRGFIEF